MNPAEMDRIAAAVNALRPDWPVASIRSLLNRPDLARRGRRDVAVALAWVACESESATPARVIENGPWWRAANADGTVVALPPQKQQECDRHPGEWADRCRGCASDQLAQEPTEHRRPRERSADEVSTAVGLARAALIRAKANLCAHGMPTGRCQHPEHDHLPTPDPHPEHESNEEK